MVIAIDGPAGSGKSTIAKLLAEKLIGRDGSGFTYINSGYLYRTITLGCLRAKISPTESAPVLEYAKNANISYQKDSVFLDSEDVTNLLHSDEIDRYSAPLSAIVPVRHLVNDLVRDIAGGQNVVVEGRDMTTVVFPGAEYRFYLDASPEARAKRRFDQGVSRLSLEEIRESILKRDEIDKNKPEGSLKLEAGVYYLDTSDLTLMQVYDKLIEVVKLETKA